MSILRLATHSLTPCQGAPRLAFAALALVMAAPAAIAQTAPAPVPVPVAAVPAVSPLAQIPGVAIQYYDVTGLTTNDMRASIESQRPKDPATGQAVPTTANWSIGTSVKKQTTGTVCKIVGATVTMKSEVVLPRLVTVEGVAAPELVHWNAYVASLEAQHAARIRPIHDRLSEVEKAVVGGTCEGAAQAASKAIDEISKPPVAVPVAATAPAAPTN